MSQPTTSRNALDSFEGDRFDDVSIDKLWRIVGAHSPETDDVGVVATGGAA